MTAVIVTDYGGYYATPKFGICGESCPVVDDDYRYAIVFESEASAQRTLARLVASEPRDGYLTRWAVVS